MNTGSQKVINKISEHLVNIDNINRNDLEESSRQLLKTKELLEELKNAFMYCF